MITKEQLLDQLKTLKVPTDKPVIVHASLKSIGAIDGGAKTLLDALIEHITSDGGLLCVPTHTWANFERGDEIILDLFNPKTCVGAFPEYAITAPEACL